MQQTAGHLFGLDGDIAPERACGQVFGFERAAPLRAAWCVSRSAGGPWTPVLRGGIPAAGFKPILSRERGRQCKNGLLFGKFVPHEWVLCTKNVSEFLYRRAG